MATDSVLSHSVSPVVPGTPRRWHEVERSLVLSATAPTAPGAALQLLGAEVVALGGTIRGGSRVSESCADLEFMFQRRRSMEVYGALLAAGLELDLNTHRQLAELCHCSHALPPGEADSYARIQLTAYAGSAAAKFLGKLRLMGVAG